MSNVNAPWTAEQVAALNQFQRLGQFHPFTCGGNHDGQTDLVATEDGWICPRDDCDYTQRWAHGFMFRPDLFTAP